MWSLGRTVSGQWHLNAGMALHPLSSLGQCFGFRSRACDVPAGTLAHPWGNSAACCPHHFPNNAKVYFLVTLDSLHKVAISTEIPISAIKQDLLARDGAKPCAGRGGWKRGL